CARSGVIYSWSLDYW
nr:immunoglobulin heavy chain junction region [Macaca mulatta]MOY22452.1 immunoglobulin heavy chain junction region [Macaca mulatta]MOY23557.1 immunoglobulin heavy chain junction region [Macaca mulatta]MOY24273.1 immunoglobulin heavy chain junction region [Macaca mulatta]MOY24274.1 immunoglobulin heavy chain junction region [Macaca mulatta]